MSVNCRRQALQFCLDPAVVVVIQICNEFLFEVFHGLKFLQVQQFALEQPKEVFYHSIIQRISLSAHALPDAFLFDYEYSIPNLPFSVKLRCQCLFFLSKSSIDCQKTQGSCRNNRLALDFVSFFFRKSQRNRPRDWHGRSLFFVV